MAENSQFLAKNTQKPIISPQNSPEHSNSQIQPQIEQYIDRLSRKGYNKNLQGVWIQSDNQVLGNYRGTIPLPAASIAKVPTTLVALQTLGTNYQFITRISTTGTLQSGVLEGDLIIEGGDDPFFVWEDAIEIGNLLNQLGIQQIKGNLLIVNKFYMNFQLSQMESGKLLKQGLDAQTWTKEAEIQHKTLPDITPRPQVIIFGTVQVISSLPSNTKPLLEHYSLPLAQLLKKMNCYSNTWMTIMLNEKLGGDAVVAQKAAQIANIPLNEIQLGKNAKISPRAAVGMFIAIQNYLQQNMTPNPKSFNSPISAMGTIQNQIPSTPLKKGGLSKIQNPMTLADVFAITRKDEGILQKRPHLPLAVLKSGIWEDISALSGALPTQKQETIWFAIINVGQPYEISETEQEIFLNDLLDEWGNVSQLPPSLQPSNYQSAYQQRTFISRQ